MHTGTKSHDQAVFNQFDAGVISFMVRLASSIKGGTPTGPTMFRMAENLRKIAARDIKLAKCNHPIACAFQVGDAISIQHFEFLLSGIDRN